MNIIKSIIRKFFPDNSSKLRKLGEGGSFTVIRGGYEFKAEAVAIMRINHQERVYYPNQPDEFFSDLTSSLEEKKEIILQINKPPSSFGLSRSGEGNVLITQVDTLGVE